VVEQLNIDNNAKPHQLQFAWVGVLVKTAPDYLLRFPSEYAAGAPNSISERYEIDWVGV
jgi:hypothetical protein